MKTVNPWLSEPETFLKARFLRRPNRFLVHCVNDQLGEIPAHLPNPGRLWELLLPGAILYLKPVAPSRGKAAVARKTQFTAIAVEREGSPVFLHTHDTNLVARYLIENNLISPLKGATVKRAEVTVGRSRFDFLLRLDKERTVNVGALNTLRFRAGYYLYVDSAIRHLTTRINRHQRKGKKPHWHIDYLTEIADHVLPIAVRSSEKLECSISRAGSAIAKPGPAGFGSSDCPCGTHLFLMADNPLHSRAFHQMLQGFRMRAPNPKK